MDRPGRRLKVDSRAPAPRPEIELLLFVTRVVVLVIALAVVWPAVAPRYSRLLAATVDLSLKARQAATTVWADEGGNLQADRSWHGRGGRLRRQASPIGVRGSWEGLLLVLALLLATPRLGWKRRLAGIAAGSAMMTVYYGIYVLAYFRRMFHPAAGSFFWFPFSEVWVPLVLWAALTFRHWFPRARDVLGSGDRVRGEAAQREMGMK